MCELNNDIIKDPNYTTRSKITRSMLREMHIPDFVSVDIAKKEFDLCKGKTVLVGLPYMPDKQRHTKVVSKYELYRQIIKGH